eukprot:GHVP01004336.1.p1 GENE.GHVP01004336.1~~GHVP01004336.1.p1  ORF type:complete len:208 (+),score=-3.99 GHVP01004336.1:497-1120(+)
MRTACSVLSAGQAALRLRAAVDTRSRSSFHTQHPRYVWKKPRLRFRHPKHEASRFYRRTARESTELTKENMFGSLNMRQAVSSSSVPSPRRRRCFPRGSVVQSQWRTCFASASCWHRGKYRWIGSFYLSLAWLLSTAYLSTILIGLYLIFIKDHLSRTPLQLLPQAILYLACWHMLTFCSLLVCYTEYLAKVFLLFSYLFERTSPQI